MPTWLSILLAIAGALSSWRWIVRPLRKAWRELLLLLQQIRDASQGVQKLAREMEALSGAVVQLSARLLEQQEKHQERLDELAELYIDIAAAIARHRRRLDQLEGAPDDKE